MSLSLPANFKQDIQGRDTNLFPIVVIGHFGGDIDTEDFVNWENNSIFLSTNGHSYVEESNNITINTLPLLLNVPSLKESIDIEKRKYKISSVNLNISNSIYDGKRLSEIVSEHSTISQSLLNEECRIFWWSPSTNWLAPNGEGDTTGFMIYNGKITKYEHSDDKVKLVLEDRSQESLHQDLPLSELPLKKDVPDKYKGKRVPMVYGSVNKSPCVIKSTAFDVDGGDSVCSIRGESSAVTFNIDETSVGSHVVTDSPLYFFDNDTYYNVQEKWSADETIPNFEASPSYAEINFKSSGDNPTSNNALAIFIVRKFTELLSHWGGGGWGTINGSDYFLNGKDGQDEDEWVPAQTSNANDGKEDTFCIIKAPAVEVSEGHTTTGARFLYLEFKLDPVPGLEEAEIDPVVKTYFIGKIKHETNVNDTASGTAGGVGNVGTKWAISEQIEQLLVDLEDVDSEGNGLVQFPGSTGMYHVAMDDYDSAFGDDEIYLLPYFTTTDLFTSLFIGIPMHYSTDGGTMDVRTKIYNAYIWQNFLVGGITDKEYYANVTGRINASPKADQVIQSILHEINSDIPDWDDTDAELSGAYDGWKYQFTIADKINSKKLIEDISSASPFVPHFNNMGGFRLDWIPDMRTSANNITFNNDNYIEADDVIDFSYSRTPEIYTKVELKYNWDYGLEKFQGRRAVTAAVFTCEDIDADGNSQSYWDTNYYGLPSDNSKSTLVIDDDRGKYIRDDDTAEKLVTWLLSWYMNQHLIIKVKLPLNYLHIEVGSLVKFDKLISNVLPYGINYTTKTQANTWHDYQAFHPEFIVTATNKTLEYVEISCTQLHTLWGTNSFAVNEDTGDLEHSAIEGSPGCETLPSCYDTTACNFDAGPGTSQDNSLCTYPGYNEECDGNCIEGMTRDNCGDCWPEDSDDWESCCGGIVDCAGVCGGDAVEDDCENCGPGLLSSGYGCGTDIFISNHISGSLTSTRTPEDCWTECQALCGSTSDEPAGFDTPNYFYTPENMRQGCVAYEAQPWYLAQASAWDCKCSCSSACDCGGAVWPDCNGDCYHTAIFDDCGICSGGNSGHAPNSDMDCCGQCHGNGSGECDECNTCNGDGTTCSGLLYFTGYNYVQEPYAEDVRPDNQTYQFPDINIPANDNFNIPGQGIMFANATGCADNPLDTCYEMPGEINNLPPLPRSPRRITINCVNVDDVSCNDYIGSESWPDQNLEGNTLDHYWSRGLQMMETKRGRLLFNIAYDESLIQMINYQNANYNFDFRLEVVFALYICRVVSGDGENGNIPSNQECHPLVGATDNPLLIKFHIGNLMIGEHNSMWLHGSADGNYPVWIGEANSEYGGLITGVEFDGNGDVPANWNEFCEMLSLFKDATVNNQPYPLGDHHVTINVPVFDIHLLEATLQYGGTAGGDDWDNFETQYPGELQIEFGDAVNQSDTDGTGTHESSFIDINYFPSVCGGIMIGDVNGDGTHNVLDIVAVANCVLNNNCASIENGCAADCNGDGMFNVLDIVTLANCVMNNNCEGI